jgi:hypothetical protein
MRRHAQRISGCADHDDQFQRGTRFGRQEPQQSASCTSPDRHRTPGVARICDVSALSHLPIGRPSSSFVREVGGSAVSIAAKKVSLLVERRVPVTAFHWIEMFLRFVHPPAIAHSRLALAKARAILSLSLQ